MSLDTIEMDGGVIAYRETIRHPGAVAMVPVTAEGNLLLVTQYRHAAGRRLLELPAGTLEAGEEPLSAVSRELQEEVDQRPGKIEPLGAFRGAGLHDRVHLPVRVLRAGAVVARSGRRRRYRDRDADAGRGAGGDRIGRDLRREIGGRDPPLASIGRINESIGGATFYSSNE
ncbi:MAG: NUDIX hydrolase [Dehalococcoidia bacterium]|nr:NUDIX hydrolase [Dehalococcoidia bacterium]